MISTAVAAIRPLAVNVEQVTSIIAQEASAETFVTQRGGKIIQGALPSMAQETARLLQNRGTLQSTLLLQKKKEMAQVQAILEKKRLEFSKRMDECREKQHELRAKQKQIRERVTKFEKFLKENDAKRLRANAKALTERKMTESKESELAGLRSQLQVERQKSDSIMESIRKHQEYERYLQSIVNILPPDYLDVNEPHINDIIMRHKTLTETNNDLVSVVQRNQDDIERMHLQLTALVKDKNNVILVTNSKLVSQQKYLDTLKQNCAYQEQRIEERDSILRERMRLLSETKLAIDDLYDGCTRRDVQSTAQEVEPGDEKTWAGKLRVLQYRVLDLAGILPLM